MPWQFLFICLEKNCKFYWIHLVDSIYDWAVVDAFDRGETDASDSRDEYEFVVECVCGGGDSASPASPTYSLGNDRICGVLRSEVLRLFNKNWCSGLIFNRSVWISRVMFLIWIFCCFEISCNLAKFFSSLSLFWAVCMCRARNRSQYFCSSLMAFNSPCSTIKMLYFSICCCFNASSSVFLFSNLSCESNYNCSLVQSQNLCHTPWMSEHELMIQKYYSKFS